jgi:tetratricopeptide (TPR) repeat protein
VITRSLSVATTVALALATPRAFAQPSPEAKVHVDAATKLHGEGKYAEALVELEAAYKLDPQPPLLYAIAQVHVKLDRCAEAIPFYEKFLATNPEPGPAEATRQAIEVCKSRLPAAPEPTPEPEPAPEPVVAPPAPEGRSAWYADPLGGALVGGGVVAGVVGFVLYRSATSDLDAAESAATYQESQDLVDGAGSKRTYAAIAGGVGIALIAGGVIRYVTRDRGGESNVAIVPARGGGLVTWSGGF